MAPDKVNYRGNGILPLFVAGGLIVAVAFLCGVHKLLLMLCLSVLDSEYELMSVAKARLESEIGPSIFRRMTVGEVRGVRFRDYSIRVFVFETDESSVRKLAKERGLVPFDIHAGDLAVPLLPDDWPRPRSPVRRGFGYNALLGLGEGEKAATRKEYLYYDNKQNIAFYRLH